MSSIQSLNNRFFYLKLMFLKVTAYKLQIDVFRFINSKKIASVHFSAIFLTYLNMMCIKFMLQKAKQQLQNIYFI